jgi:hypothetical protein
MKENGGGGEFKYDIFDTIKEGKKRKERKKRKSAINSEKVHSIIKLLSLKITTYVFPFVLVRSLAQY